MYDITHSAVVDISLSFYLIYAYNTDLGFCCLLTGRSILMAEKPTYEELEKQLDALKEV
jgi:hypothetical protein